MGKKYSHSASTGNIVGGKNSKFWGAFCLEGFTYVFETSS